MLLVLWEYGKRKVMLDTTVDRIVLDALLGKEISEEDKQVYKHYSVKYARIRKQVLVELNKDPEKDTVAFHFTPGRDFMDTPDDQIVKTIMKSFVATEMKS